MKILNFGTIGKNPKTVTLIINEQELAPYTLHS